MKRPWMHGVTHDGVKLVLDEHGNYHDAWEWEHRELIERLSRKMAEQCGQDPDMMVCLGQPDKVALPGTWGYRQERVGTNAWSTRVKPLWRYYERLAIVAIRELNDGEAKRVGDGLPTGPTSSIA